MTLQKYFVTTQRLNKRGNNAFDRVQKDQLKDADPLHASYRFQESNTKRQINYRPPFK
jgi:hypothetical protein